MKSIYRYAEGILQVPYERELDLAILSHGVFFDQIPNREDRTLEWLFNFVESQTVNTERLYGYLSVFQSSTCWSQTGLLLSMAEFFEWEDALKAYAVLEREGSAEFSLNRITFLITFNDFLCRKLTQLNTTRFDNTPKVQFALKRTAANMRGIQAQVWQDLQNEGTHSHPDLLTPPINSDIGLRNFIFGLLSGSHQG